MEEIWPPLSGRNCYRHGSRTGHRHPGFRLYWRARRHYPRAGGGYLCYVAVNIIRNHLHIDDSLDVFAVHGVGGIVGSLLVAVLATDSFSGLGLAEGMSIASQFGIQAICVAITVIWTALPLMQFLRLPGFWRLARIRRTGGRGAGSLSAWRARLS